MKHIKPIFNISMFSQIVMAFLLLSLPITGSYARAGCCANHGGVAGCNSATGFQRCNDGSTSPSCTCTGANVSTTHPVVKTKAVKSATQTKTVVKPATQTKTATKPVAKAKAATKPATKAKAAAKPKAKNKAATKPKAKTAN